MTPCPRECPETIQSRNRWCCVLFSSILGVTFMFVVGGRGNSSNLDFFWFYFISFLPAESTGLGFVCFIVINLCVLSANRVDLGSFAS